MSRIADVFIRLLAEATGFRADVVKQAQLAGDEAGKTLGARMVGGINSAAGKIGDALGAASKSLVATGRAMTTNITLPILAAGGAAAKMALDFDTAGRQIVGLTDVTGEQLDSIKAKILELGPAIGKSPQELIEAFYFIASAGFEAEEAMEVLEVSARAAASGLGQTQVVAQTLGGVINAYGKENITAARAADILTEAVSQGTAEADAFANVVGRVVPAAAGLGVSFDQVTAALAGMTLTGLSAEEAAVGLNQVFISLLKPTKQSADAMEDMGLSAAGLRQQLKEEGLLATLRTLEERFGANEDAAAQVFGNVRALRSVTSLLTLDQAQLNAIFDKTADSLGRAATAYEETEGPQREMQRNLADLQATAIELGTDILPMVVAVLKEIAGGARALAGWWRSLDEGTRAFVVRLLAFAAVAGPLVLVVGKLAGGLAALFKTVQFLTGTRGIPALVGHLRGGGGLVALLLGAAVAIGQVGSATNNWIRSLGRSQKDLKDFKTLLGLVGDEARANELEKYFSMWGIGVEDFARAVEAAGGDAEAAFSALQESGGDLNAAMLELVGGATTMSEEWAETWRFMSQSVKTGSGGMIEGVQRAADEVEVAAEAIPHAVSGPLGDFYDEVLSAAQEGVTDPVQEALELAVQAAAKAATDIISELQTGLATGPEEIRDEIDALVDALVNPFTRRERQIKLEGAAAAKAIRDGLKSGDPLLEAQAFETVNGLLEQYELIAPGAFEKGELVNPKFQDGIDSNLAAALAWVQTNVTGEYTNLFDLADVLEEMGYDSLASYARGIMTARVLALVPAVTAAQRDAKAGWKFDLYGSGYDTANSWLNGMLAALGGPTYQKMLDNVAYIKRVFGGSLPTEGPLAGGLASGGTSLGESWFAGWIRALRAGIPALSSMLAFDTASPYMTGTLNYQNARGIASEGDLIRGSGAKHISAVFQAPMKERSVVEATEELRRAEYLGNFEVGDDE